MLFVPTLLVTNEDEEHNVVRIFALRDSGKGITIIHGVSSYAHLEQDVKRLGARPLDIS